MAESSTDLRRLRVLRGRLLDMTIADIDVWRAADLLIKRHGGKDAAIVAAQRADECLASGDLDGQGIWKRIVEAILDLLRTAPNDGERIN
jgi:hypothetical protein